MGKKGDPGSKPFIKEGFEKCLLEIRGDLHTCFCSITTQTWIKERQASGWDKRIHCYKMCQGLCWPEAKLCIPPYFFPAYLTWPEPTLPPEAVWSTLGNPLHRMSRWNLFYLCPAFCRGRNQGNGSPWVPF